ncbi:hypothetical protein FGO68_gene10055 [Halteria grandinella]|uniref:Uncharacterized protein n=1 Tax=Halteria grandinella TaxID=5974 RepID=A0A8J8T682_HALGN|nr:hypothetical protein FGO68_gene10055 [Halteria grandinella]
MTINNLTPVVLNSIKIIIDEKLEAKVSILSLVYTPISNIYTCIKMGERLSNSAAASDKLKGQDLQGSSEINAMR